MAGAVYVFEYLDEGRQRRLFTPLGVEWLATPLWWISPLSLLAAGQITSCIIDSSGSVGVTVLRGVDYALLMVLAITLHWLGRLIGGRLVGAPMTGQLLTATLPVNQYRNVDEHSRKEHLPRALGAPAMNLVVGLLTLIVYLWGADSPFVLFFAVINLIFSVVSLTPILSMDGGVVLREPRQPTQ